MRHVRAEPRKDSIYAVIAAGLLFVLLVLAACAKEATPTPVVTRVIRPSVPVRVTVHLVPMGETHPLPSPASPLTPRLHFPLVGQHGGLSSPSPSAVPSPRPTPVVPSPAPSFPTPSPTQGPTPSPPAQRVHIPILLSNPPPITGEPLPASGQYLALVLDISRGAADPLSKENVSRLDALRSVLPRVMRTAAGDAKVAVFTLSGEENTCTENVHQVQGLQSAGELRWNDLLTPLQPGGNIPLAEGLLQAADVFPAGVRRPILLISAGGPTCGEDPCQIARVLERAEADASIHVIDMGADGAGGAILRCISQASGGAYYEVRTRQDLEGALRDALTHALGGQIRVEVVGANARPFFPAVVVGKAAQVVRTFDAWTDADLAPGSYTVSVGTPFPLAFENVEVRAGERTRLHVQLGELRILLNDRSGQPISAEVAVSRPDYGTFFSRVGSRVEVPLPAGRYTATVRLDTGVEPLAYARNLPVVVGEVTERRLTLPVGRLVVDLRHGGAAATAFVEIAPVDTPNLISMAGWANGTLETMLPRGEYQVRVRRYAGNKVFLQVEDVVVEEGQAVTLNLRLDDGTVRVADTAADGSILSGTIQVFARETNTVVAEGYVGTPLTVPAGEYDILIQTDEGESLWAWNISVRAEEETEVVVERPQARLWARATDTGGRDLPAWGTLMTLDGAAVREGRLPGRWIVPPGEYRLEITGYDALGTTTESPAISLAPGDVYTLTITADVAALLLSPADADRVQVAIFPAGDHDTMLGEVEGGLPYLRLPPGTYDVRVRDASNLSRERWFEDITLTPGETRQIHFSFE